MPTINDGSKHFQAVTYTGNGSTNTITGFSFQPDFVWIKGRSGATDHAIYDAVRGTTLDLASNTTAAETTQSTGLTAFNSTGFTLGALSKVNTNGATYVAWGWKGGNGTVSNTSGSITSTVSANTSAGFSVVTYNATGANATFGHGLGVAPSMVFIKKRSGGTARAWQVYHSSLGNGGGLYLNQTDAYTTDAAAFNNTSPTSTTFSIGTSIYVNEGTSPYVAYCFAPVSSFSAFGSFVGNGSSDGPMVFTNFRARYLLVKASSTTGDWVVIDTSRSPYNVSADALYANGNFAEDNNVTNRSVDFLSNGFKIRSSGTFINTSGATYIYAAFAENPFKYSRAR